MEGRGQRCAAEIRGFLPFAQHRHVHSRLHGDQALDTEAAQERLVGDAAAQDHVLAVVDPVALALDGERRTTEARPRLVERHVGAVVGALDRGSETREPAAHDGNPRPAHAALARLRASTHPFSQLRSDGRRSRAPAGSDAIRSSRQPVRTGHRQDARRAAAVEKRHESKPAIDEAEPPLRLERDEEIGVAFDSTTSHLAAEPLHVLTRQVDPPAGNVFAEIA